MDWRGGKQTSDKKVTEGVAPLEFGALTQLDPDGELSLRLQNVSKTGEDSRGLGRTGEDSIRAEGLDAKPLSDESRTPSAN